MMYQPRSNAPTIPAPIHCCRASLAASSLASFHSLSISRLRSSLGASSDLILAHTASSCFPKRSNRSISSTTEPTTTTIVQSLLRQTPFFRRTDQRTRWRCRPCKVSTVRDSRQSREPESGNVESFPNFRLATPLTRDESAKIQPRIGSHYERKI